MFSPSTWLHDNSDSDVSLQSLPEEDTIVTGVGEYNTNSKLAKFFAQKGSDPLNEVEMEGVRALLAQSTSSKPSPKGQTQTQAQTQAQAQAQSNFDPDDSLVLKHGMEVPSGLATPSFKPTYNTSAVESDFSLSSMTPQRRVYDYSGFPSPYRTARLKTSTLSLGEKAKGSVESVQQPKAAKKLSDAASVLLSFIEGNEPEKPKEEAKEIDFSNPYARVKRPVVQQKKLSPLEQLEKSFQAEPEKQHQSQPLSSQPAAQPVVVDKYKPAKSSSLRESVSLEDEDKSMADESTETNGDAAATDVPVFPTSKPTATLESKVTTNEETPKPTSQSLSLPTKVTNNTNVQNSVNNLSVFSFNSPVSGEIIPSNGTVKHVTFQFPNAASTGLSASDADDSRVAVLKDFFTF